MVAVAKATSKTVWFTQLNLVRPRFVYLWVRVQEIPVPIFLFAPLVALELFLWMALWILRQNHDSQTAFALHALEALRNQTWALRKMPPFALVEIEFRSKNGERPPKQAHVKIGLW